MGLREFTIYGALLVGGFVGGNRVEHYVNTIPAENRANAFERDLHSCRAETEKYTLHLSNGKEATLNPDMSVTISGIDGFSTQDIDHQEFRRWKK